MGVPKEEIDQVLESSRTDMRIAGFDEEEKRMRQRMSNGFDSPLKLPQGSYIFGDFKTLDLPGIKVFNDLCIHFIIYFHLVLIKIDMIISIITYVL